MVDVIQLINDNNVRASFVQVISIDEGTRVVDSASSESQGLLRGAVQATNCSVKEEATGGH